jgi:hypothetical protein
MRWRNSDVFYQGLSRPKKCRSGARTEVLVLANDNAGGPLAIMEKLEHRTKIQSQACSPPECRYIFWSRWPRVRVRLCGAAPFHRPLEWLEIARYNEHLTLAVDSAIAYGLSRRAGAAALNGAATAPNSGM